MRAPDKTGAGKDAAAQGALLRSAREKRGLSVAEAARRVALSCDQVEQIENGGSDAFYSLGHKWLATRKYALTFGIALPDLPDLPEPAEDDERDAADAGTPLLSTGHDAPDNADAVRSPWRRMAMPAAVLLCTVIALSVSQAMLQQLEALLSVPTTAPAPAALALAPETRRTPEAADPLIDAGATATTPADCRETSEDDHAERWAPDRAKRRDLRLFLSSVAEADVCVIDADHTPTRLTLRPGVTAIVEGKPPYLLRSEHLPRLRIVFQGLQVTVPPAANAVRLFRAGAS